MSISLHSRMEDDTVWETSTMQIFLQKMSLGIEPHFVSASPLRGLSQWNQKMKWHKLCL